MCPHTAIYVCPHVAIFLLGPTQAAALAKVESLRMAAEASKAAADAAAGTQFTCFSSTKVQAFSVLVFLVQKYVQGSGRCCSRYSVYVFY